MKKVLYVASKVKLHINLFHIPFFIELKAKGYEVNVCASNDYKDKEDCVIPGCDVFFDVSFHRIPIHPRNIKAYFKLKKIIDSGNYDIIHCHTPIGGALARLAAGKARKKGSKVIYTAHGFHFFDGASAVNWMFYYPAERILAKLTDLIITINDEDYHRAKTFKCRWVEKMNGVGIDTEQFINYLDPDGMAFRNELNIPNDSIVLVFAGEMSYRKHQDFLIRLVADLNTETKVHLILAGEGSYTDKYKEIAFKKGILDKVHFLGFRTDIKRLMKNSDIYVSASRQEGLPVNIIEAMATGLPIVCFNIRGNRDLIADGKGGCLVPFDDANEFRNEIVKLIDDSDKRQIMGTFNRDKVPEYEKSQLVKEMLRLYNRCLDEKN